ncbi:hypothetical protein SAMN05518849_12815 [Sphingobium sp. AP50]|nr:hypothetical protein SAMN05518849_12815 [Sphingobium sp. AP50]
MLLSRLFNVREWHSAAPKPAVANVPAFVVKRMLLWSQSVPSSGSRRFISHNL